MVAFIKSLRPPQWIKNSFVFIGLIFSKQFFYVDQILQCVLAFFLFSFVSGFVYIVNDVADIEVDRSHPEKRNRPIASGKISVSMALFFGSILLIVSLGVAIWFDLILFGILLFYLVMNLLYSFFLKHVVIIDIFILSLGFLLRAIGGVVIIHQNLTHWFALCIFLLALVLAAGKRRQELLMEEKGLKKRRVMEEYNSKLLDLIIGISIASTLMTYSLYTIHVDEQSIIKYLYLTIPLVVYGLFRYLYIVYYRGEGGNPEKLLFKDMHILMTALLYFIALILILTVFN